MSLIIRIWAKCPGSRSLSECGCLLRVRHLRTVSETGVVLNQLLVAFCWYPFFKMTDARIHADPFIHGHTFIFFLKWEQWKTAWLFVFTVILLTLHFAYPFRIREKLWLNKKNTGSCLQFWWGWQASLEFVLVNILYEKGMWPEGNVCHLELAW